MTTTPLNASRSSVGPTPALGSVTEQRSVPQAVQPGQPVAVDQLERGGSAAPAGSTSTALPAQTIGVAQYGELARLIDDATKSRVSGLDLFLLVATVGFSTPVSLDRVAGVIEADEAATLAEAARRLDGQRLRIAIAALERLRHDGLVRLPRNAQQRAEAERILAELASRATPGPADRQVGDLLAYGDTALQHGRATVRDLKLAADAARRGESRPVTSTLTEQDVSRLATALEAVPTELRQAVHNGLRAGLGLEQGWPEGWERLAPMQALRTLLALPAGQV